METPVIQVRELTKKFGHFTAVDHISFDVHQGEIFGFLGANGAGKTTAMRMICGLLTPTSGKVDVLGLNIATQTDAVKRQIGYMSQKFSLYDGLTVRENVTFYGGIYGMGKDQLKLKIAELAEKLGLEDKIDHQVSSLPLGWKQKLAFLVAIQHDPKVVFLDEPTGGVDPITRRQFWELIYEAAERGITVFVTTHYMDEAEYCDRVCIMVDGSVAALDRPENLRHKMGKETMHEVFYQLARAAQRQE
ncbi:MAG TPA: ABC transporter ATP-binding protein [Saprospiraceae bacterium]|nr:ABC transporter ATP-binding protein [Saprospiraceae bacterium]MCB9268038.1 ABC transporter ATP-binding protein [Lewinellaceae bacterium]HPG07510.1 ABC transporter ATP-binding protein [Saprospiraceae bacterium]HPQ98634.1 ABC transporter ATP-binding protein [Saprospiraceae bacterium]HRV85900.1 ABC transporter ATP-binding protein [Saprospiraceae bacterium]